MFLNHNSFENNKLFRIGGLGLILLLFLSFLLASCQDGIILPPPVFEEPVTPWTGESDTAWYTGNSSSYTLDTAEELAGLATLVDGGNSFNGIIINLDNDIDLANLEWNPIGTAWESGHSFQGTFDGRNHEIANFYINDDTANGNSNAGFFGGVGGKNEGDGGTVMNIKFKNAHVEAAGHRVGIAVGALHYGTVIGIETDSTSSVNRENATSLYAGGIVGASFHSTIIGCTNAADVYGQKSSGGIAGYFLHSTIEDCTNYGNLIAVNSDGGIGGIVGFVAGETDYNSDNNLSTITKCNNYGNITSTVAGELFGGVIGRIGGAPTHNTPVMKIVITDSHNYGKITASDGSDCTDEKGLFGGIAHYSTGNDANVTVIEDGTQIFPEV